MLCVASTCGCHPQTLRNRCTNARVFQVSIRSWKCVDAARACNLVLMMSLSMRNTTKNNPLSLSYMHAVAITMPSPNASKRTDTPPVAAAGRRWRHAAGLRKTRPLCFGAILLQWPCWRAQTNKNNGRKRELPTSTNEAILTCTDEPRTYYRFIIYVYIKQFDLR